MAKKTMPKSSNKWTKKNTKATSKGKPMSLPSIKRYAQVLTAFETLRRIKKIHRPDVYAYLRHYLLNKRFEDLMNPKKFGAGFASGVWDKFLRNPGSKDKPPGWRTDSGKLLSPARETTTDSSPLMKPELVETCTAQPVQRTSPGSTDGIKYYCKFEVRHGKPDTMLQHAIDEFGVKSRTLWTTGGQYLTDLMFSQSGVNRKGYWQPVNKVWKNIDAALGVDLLNWEAYESHGCISKGLIYMFCEQYGISDNVSTYLGQRNAGNLDLLLPIVSTHSVHTIRSSMTDTPLDVTVYLLRRKSGISTRCPLAETFYVWGENNTQITTNDSFAPKTGLWQQGGQQAPSPNTQAYDLAFPRKLISRNCADSEGNQQTIEFSGENTSVLGFFPTWSPEFRRKYEIIEKKTQRLKPMDTIEVHFDEYFSRCFSYRDFSGTFGDDLASVPKSTYCRGDYDILVTHQGIPGTCSVPNPGEEPSENVRMSADALRSRIRKTVSHKIRYAWKTLAYNDPTSSFLEPDELFRQGWITSAIRETTVSRRTAYFEDGGNSIIMSNMTEKEGDGI